MFFLGIKPNASRGGYTRRRGAVRFASYLGGKRVILTRSPFGTVEIDRALLSCIVMHAPKNDSDAFFLFSLVFPCLFAFFASESD